MARKLPIPNGRLDGALDANGMRIVNLADPLSDDDAATKGFVRKNAVNAGVRKVNGMDGDVVLTGVDIPISAAPGSKDVSFVVLDIANSVGAFSAALGDHVNSRNNPHGVTANDVGAYTKAETDAKVAAAVASTVEISGEYEDGSAFSFQVLTKGE